MLFRKKTETLTESWDRDGTEAWERSVKEQIAGPL